VSRQLILIPGRDLFLRIFTTPSPAHAPVDTVVFLILTVQKFWLLPYNVGIILIIIHLSVFGFEKFIEISIWVRHYLGDVFRGGC